MNITTQRGLIQAVADRWHATYQPFNPRYDNPLSFVTGMPIHMRPKKETWELLKGLDLETATAEEVDAVIGNSSWTRLKCDECGEEVGAVIHVGEDPDYESSTASLCYPCCVRAYTLMSAHFVTASAEPPAPEPSASVDR
jgi:hypothetical protein